MIRVVQVIVFFGLMLTASSCSKYADVYAEVDKVSYEFQGFKRHFLYYTPKDYNPEKKYPLVIVMHGITSKAEEIAKFSKFNRQADRCGYIVCYPQGYKRSWAIDIPVGPAPKKGVDDVAYLHSVVDTINQSLNVDWDNIFSCGISNGAFMSMRLACEAPELIRAMALVSGNMFDPPEEYCANPQPTPLLMIAGSEDPLLNYHGSRVGGYSTAGFEKTMEFWSEVNKSPFPCDSLIIDESVKDKTLVVKKYYYGTPSNAEIVLYKVEEGGHTWPGRKKDYKALVLGKVSSEIDASVLIADFFLQQMQ